MNIGLVLSGGMAKGAYQIGALKALEDFIPNSEIKYISCASVGVLNGYAYATGSLERAEQMWKGLCCGDTQYVITQVLKSGELQQNINELYDEEKSLSSAFYCSLFDFSNKNIVYKDLSKVQRDQITTYLKASVAMPIYNRSVRLDDISYFDGAMIDNIPIYPLSKYDLDYIICIYFDDACYKFESSHLDSRIIKITFPSQSILKQSLVFDKNGIDNMIKSGYETARELLGSIFSNGYTDLDYIYSAINAANKSGKNTTLRITGDVIVTNLNKLAQRFSKRKLI